MEAKHLAISAVALAWLWYFFGGPAFLALLFVPFLAAMILSLWKKRPAMTMVEPLLFSFLLALAASTLTATMYRLSFDLVFRGIVLAFPLFTVVPLFVLLALFLAMYGLLTFRELEKASPALSVSSFYLSQIAALPLAYAVIWIGSGGLSL